MVKDENVFCQTIREWKNLKVIEIDFKSKINGCVSKWGEDSGEYRMFIDSNLSEKEKLEAFIHEMIHLYHDDLNNDTLTVSEIEFRAHRETAEIMDKLSDVI